MTTINLFTFFLTGQFGPIKPGITQKELIGILGEPRDTLEHEFGRILFYGKYEFHILSYINPEDIILIYNDNMEYNPHQKNGHRNCICSLAKHFLVDPWPVRTGKNVSYKQVITMLKANNISFSEIETPGIPGDWSIYSEVNVQLLFVHDQDYKQGQKPESYPPNPNARFTGISLCDPRLLL